MRLITLLVLEIVLDLNLNIISWYHAQSYARNDPTNVFNRTVCQIPEPIGGRKNKWNGRRMVNLKGTLNLISSSMRFTFMTNNINFNSTVIWSQFSTVAVFFLIKNELVPCTSLVKGLHVRTKFLPVPENRTQVFGARWPGVTSTCESKVHWICSGDLAILLSI